MHTITAGVLASALLTAACTHQERITIPAATVIAQADTMIGGGHITVNDRAGMKLWIYRETPLDIVDDDGHHHVASIKQIADSCPRPWPATGCGPLTPASHIDFGERQVRGHEWALLGVAVSAVSLGAAGVCAEECEHPGRDIAIGSAIVLGTAAIVGVYVLVRTGLAMRSMSAID